RAMAFTRTAAGLCIANLHATNDRPRLAAEDVTLAAERATEWATGAPLLFGGDLNLRPAEDPEVFARLNERFGLSGETGPRAIDHLLSRGLQVSARARAMEADGRELRREGGVVRLSDHAPVQAGFSTSPSQ
ncbi:MAG TPA: hypothetical protein VG518_07400, partial [Solirubrobacterales bacterium]|nr:hypothetical protein [Solirubrobacterales bacterium]